MFAFIKGILEQKGLEYIVIESKDIGYKIFMSKSAIEQVGEIGEKVKVHTFLKVKEDDVSIYGFNNIEELRMFELLISVGGIGAKSAINILSNIEPASFALAVITDDLITLKKLPGIGPKSAGRIILELKDKLKTEQATQNVQNIDLGIKVDTANDKVQDAISALQVLGYTRKDIDDCLSKMDISSMSVEDMIKCSLRNLSR